MNDQWSPHRMSAEPWVWALSACVGGFLQHGKLSSLRSATQCLRGHIWACDNMYLTHNECYAAQNGQTSIVPAVRRRLVLGKPATSLCNVRGSGVRLYLLTWHVRSAHLGRTCSMIHHSPPDLTVSW